MSRGLMKGAARAGTLAAVAAAIIAYGGGGPGVVGPAEAQEKFISLTGSVQQVTLAPNDTITVRTGKPFGDLVIGSAR